jgi:hypothetical protein
MMILFAIYAILSLFWIASLKVAGIVLGIIFAGINGYYFIVTYSLYDRFRFEPKGGATAQYQQSGVML